MPHLYLPHCYFLLLLLFFSICPNISSLTLQQQAVSSEKVFNVAMAKDPTLKKKRKSEVAGLEGAVAPEAVPAAEGTASAEAVVAEVDAEKAAKKAKKEKRKSVAATEDVVMESADKDKKVCCYVSLPCLNADMKVRLPCTSCFNLANSLTSRS
jgi:hypothetical protein